MPVKILLADKSITIQKVVEMLFSGREYEVACVSDGDTALHEAERLVPDVPLADVDLPRVDGYSLAMRLKKDPTLARIPIILMMSRDDVYDNTKGKQAGIIDKIVKPFESQELIGKVKKALAAAPPRPAEPVSATPPPPKSAATAQRRTAQTAFAPKQMPPADIFDIISEAPTSAELKQAPSPVKEETVYEVEPVVEEVEAPLTREVEKALPTGARTVEEMRADLGLFMVNEQLRPEPIAFESFDKTTKELEKPAVSSMLPLPAPATPPAGQSEIVAFSSLDMVRDVEQMFAPQKPEKPPSGVPGLTTIPIQQTAMTMDELRNIVEETVSRMAAEAFNNISPPSQPQISAETMRNMAAETISRMAADVVKDITPPPIPKISEETIRRGIQEAVAKVAREIAREVIEQVAWEVIPQLAEHLIQEEIERLKAGT